MVKRMRQRITQSGIKFGKYPHMSPSIGRSEELIAQSFIDGTGVAAASFVQSKCFEMGVSKIQGLSGDALLEIFFHLNADELWNCEKVCVDWKNVISCEALWKNILLRKEKSDPRWSKISKCFSKLHCESKDGSYKLKFKTLYEKIERLDRNWLSGKFTEKSVLIQDHSLGRVLDMDDDHVSILSLHPLIFERTNMTLTHSLGDPDQIFSHLIISENLIFCSLKDRIRVVEAHNGNKICEIFDPRELDLGPLSINNRKQLAALGFFNGTNHLTVWKMEGPTDFRLIHQEYFNAPNAAVWSDEDYIALAFDSSFGEYEEYEVRLISTTTFETERSFGFRKVFFHYDRGLLFVAKRRDDTIRIMEAKSGQWIKNIFLKSGPFIDFFWDTYLPIRLNSNFMVIVTESLECPPNCHIYDLEAIRNPSSKECLLTTISLPKQRALVFAVDETQIVFTGSEIREGNAPREHLTVLDFS